MLSHFTLRNSKNFQTVKNWSCVGWHLHVKWDHFFETNLISLLQINLIVWTLNLMLQFLIQKMCQINLIKLIWPRGGFTLSIHYFINFIYARTSSRGFSFTSLNKTCQENCMKTTRWRIFILNVFMRKLQWKNEIDLGYNIR